ncbi:CarboxypepD_reg-like domain-containing protein [Filimonas lacunae]|uniref:CarboxypepD_reg-like domain-containing protein n=1 Tax=Filimonas lacunae TaxID=477680 RepID=A0A173MGA2_9BACT|nr:DUF5686 family protein [Filimonas lacunae]BAV06654.1 hypothetical protein FLA_2673 [Filimonas lacunae]SIT27771.1 CarboxypepD_reg-like domain-containing protein [Filimonas lacunae]
MTLKQQTCFLLLFSIMAITCAYAQEQSVEGVVLDSVTHTPIAHVSVFDAGKKQGTRTNARGEFELLLKAPCDSLVFFTSGYQRLLKAITSRTHQKMTVLLPRQYEQLEGVTVGSNKHRHYSNKNNPAVDFIRQVIAHKQENDMGAFRNARFNSYEKLCLYLDGFPHWIADSKLLKRYHFLFENKDTTKYPGKELTPVYIQEKLFHNYYSTDPDRKNSLLAGQKKVDYGEFIDTKGVSTILGRLYEDINIYDNAIVAFTRQFMSPIADGGPAYYQYYIVDTVKENNVRLLKLYVTPRNTNALLFTGNLFITLDGHYTVYKWNMHTNKHMNLGLVRGFTVTQDFSQDSASHKYYLSHSDVVTDFGLTKKGSGLFGERVVTVSDFNTTYRPADSLFRKDWRMEYDTGYDRPDSFFTAYREKVMTASERQAYANIDSLNKMKSYQFATKLVNMGATGYFSFNKVDVGPLYTFLSYNSVEGVKGRFGARTNSHFSKRYYLDGYLAYGTKDRQWKQFGSIAWSLNHRSVYQYPMHYVKFSYRHDTNIPGMDDEYVESNILMAIKTGTNNKYLYNYIYRLDYLHEFGNHIAIRLGFKNRQQLPAGGLYFLPQATSGKDTTSSITTSEISAQIRWAPHEQFYQTQTDRYRISNKYPVMTLTLTHGIRQLFKGQYNYNRIDATIKKRFYVVPLGYTDVKATGGWVTGRLPWPLLAIHEGNQSAGYNGTGYNMMNYLEFVSDHYAGINIDHSFKGFFFDRIPLLKKLKWREGVSCRILWGGLRNENKPVTGNAVFSFPANNNVPTMFSLNNGPYIEAGAGISRIFKVLRVDVLKRFTYLNNPGVSPWTIRWGLGLEL